MSLETPLGRVLGRGAARDGVAQWWAQRLTALALVPLGAWLVVALLGLPDLQYDTVAAWLAAPMNAILMLALLPTLGYHSYLGVIVVVEDYVHGEGTKVALRVLLAFGYALAMIAALFAILRVAFGAAP